MHPLAHSALIGGAVMTVIAVSLAMGRGPVHQLRDNPFQDTHEDMATLAAMSERVEALGRPRMVQTESVKPIEPDPLMAVLSEPAMAAQPRRKAAAASDICAKHGLRKVYDGPRWRCRK